MQLTSKIYQRLLLAVIGLTAATSISLYLPIDWIKAADCTLGYECGLYRQSLIIAAVYHIPVNPLHRMSFALMLLVYYVTTIVFSKSLIKGFSQLSK